MKKTRRLSYLYQVAVFLLVLLWVYTATSKLSNLDEFKLQLGKQHFGPFLTNALLWAIPITEAATAILLVIHNTRLIGLYSAFFLMVLFTGYIGLVLVGFYKQMPCSCGGVLQYMGWHLHFWFNVFFLLLAAIGIWLEKRREESFK